MNYDVGAFGILFGVTNGVVNAYLYDGVGTVIIECLPIVDGASYVGIITAVVCGITTIDDVGTDVGTDVHGTITGETGIDVTTI